MKNKNIIKQIRKAYKKGSKLSIDGTGLTFDFNSMTIRTVNHKGTETIYTEDDDRDKCENVYVTGVDGTVQVLIHSTTKQLPAYNNFGETDEGYKEDSNDDVDEDDDDDEYDGIPIFPGDND